MALHDLVTHLESIRELLLSSDEQLETYDKDLDLGYSGGLKRLRTEVEDQIRTASRPFTIAVVGEFKAGKSTLLNGLLGLSGETSLSAEDTPDTACSILLRERQSGDPEARLTFQDGSPPASVSWQEAKRYTSQVTLDGDAVARERAGKLLEVEYFVESPLLAQAQFNDLPGTGSRYWREHTALTHRKMKEADAVLWVVAEREPSADARRDLEVLAQYSQTVIPIVNVVEDPLADPPLPRQPARDQEISDVLVREFRSFFSPEIEAPLQVSARVVEIERAKRRPSAAALRKAGYEALLQLLEKMFLSHQEQQAKGRKYRLCGAAMAVLDKAQSELFRLRDDLEDRSRHTDVHLRQTSRRVAEINQVENLVRGSLRTIAQARAAEICDRVAGDAGVFVKDQLQFSKIRHLGRSLTKKGRAKLEAELQQTFERDYLKLHKKPNWLDGIHEDYNDQVGIVVLAEWSRLAATGGGGQTQRWQPLEERFADIDRLGDDIRQAVASVFFKLLGVAAFTGLLALIPGAGALVALGLLGSASVASASNPMAERRRRAAEQIQRQVQSQRRLLGTRLLKAGEAGSKVLRDEVNEILSKDKDAATKKHVAVRHLTSEIRNRLEDVDVAREALAELQSDPRGA